MSDTKILNYLIHLVEKEFLLTSLRPSLLEEPFKYVLTQIKSYYPHYEKDHLCQALFDVDRALCHYDEIPIGSGEKEFINVIDKMQKVVNTKHFLQVDVYNNQNVLLNKRIKKDIEKAAEILFRISSKNTSSDHLKEYYKDFVEEYGYSTEVPILELLDDSLGIGSPATYTNPQSYRITKNHFKNKKREFLLSAWISETLLAGKTEIQLNEEIIKLLENEDKDSNDAPDSLELYFTLAAKSAQHIDAGNYSLILLPNTGSIGAGKSFGRFTDLFTDLQIEKLKTISGLEQQRYPHAIFAEVSYLPAHGKASNIMITENFYPYEIVLETTSSNSKKLRLGLSDLVVGATGQRLYIKSKSLNKEVIPVVNHMMNNSTMMPNIYRFLFELGAERNRTWELFNWGELSIIPFLPRLSYGNIVLSLAVWRINRMLTMFQSVDNMDEWVAAVKKWRIFYHVPRYVNLTVLDHRILMDLEQPSHVHLLYKNYKKMEHNESLIITELGYPVEHCWVNNEENHFFIMEGVFPVVKNKKDNEKESANNNLHLKYPGSTQRINYISKLSRSKPPGSDWLFIKLYGHSYQQNELICSFLHSFCNKIEQSNVANYSFFTRYADPRPHLRLRFHGEPKTLIQNLLPIVCEWTNELKLEGLIHHMEIDTYNPEIERYGGSNCIHLAEKLFAADSKTSYALLAMKESDRLTIPFDFVSVLSILHLLDQFGFSFSDQLQWINSRVSSKRYNKEIREFGKEILLLAASTDNWNNLRSHPQGMDLISIYNMRKEQITLFSERIDGEFPKKNIE